MKILCKLLGHKYKIIYNIFNERIKEKCKRCGDIKDLRKLLHIERGNTGIFTDNSNTPDCTVMYLIDGKEYNMNVKWDMTAEPINRGTMDIIYE